MRVAICFCLRSSVRQVTDRPSGLRTSAQANPLVEVVHFDVVTESLRDDVQLIATGLAALSQRDPGR